MVKKRFTTFFIWTFFLGSNFSFSQRLQKENKDEVYRAIHWSKENGLFYGLYDVMIKDVKGFLWVGGAKDELGRFDGAEFKKYFPDPNKPGAINSANILALTEDSLHNIWVGTEKGISRYDIKGDTFTNFVTGIDSINIDASVRPFWSTSKEVFCFESTSRIVAYDIHALKRRLVLTLVESDKTFPSAYGMVDTASNSLWLQENMHDSHYAGLLHVSLKDGTRKHYTWDCYRNNVQHNHGSEAMQYDPNRNSIWLNTGDGLLEFSLSDKKFRKVEALRAFENLKNYDRYVGIDIDRDGKIWFATQPKGILIYDPKTEEARPVFSDTALVKKTGSINMHIYCDREGIAWTSFWYNYGIYEILPSNLPVTRYSKNSSVQRSLSNNTIVTIVPGPDGEIWIGTEDGLNILDPVTEKFEVIRPKDLKGLRGQTVIPLHVDTIHKRAWVCSMSFLKSDLQVSFPKDFYEMDIKTRICKPINFPAGIKPSDRLSVVPAWQIPYKNGFLFEEDFHGVFEIKGDAPFADLTISNEEPTPIERVVLKEDRYLFLKNFGQKEMFPLNFTFENKNGKWTRIPHMLDSLKWLNILFAQKDHTHWVGFDHELVHYDKDFKKIKSYGPGDGYTGRVYNMEEDNSGNIWFNTIANKLCHLNATTGLITVMSESDGFCKQTYDWYGPALKDATGNLYFGGTSMRDGIGGLDRIRPERYRSVVTSSVYLRSLTINRKPFSLPLGVNDVEELSLHYDQNTISIETGVIDFYSGGKDQIRYKLERNGKEEDWQYGPGYYTIRYESLPPGIYKLLIQASNPSEEFNSPEKILMIYISPPFWETWWFRVFAFLFLVDLIYTIVRWRLKQKFKLQLERSENEREVAELQQQKTELEMQALRAQMNPHFIFNSLNSINRFILQNNRTQASEYLTKFSKLVRMILQNSQASLISLESELESLNLYLDLEAVRFEHRFAYKISYSKDLDIEVLQVPPLVIQPFTENAIWHGLMHKEEKGQLDIDVSEEDDCLYIKITDNGIGRKKAGEMANKSTTKHKSMGLRITKDRIAMLQKSNGGESPVRIIDLENEDGSAAGTEVIIKMPVIEEA